MALAQKIGLGQVLVARVGRRRVGFLHHGSPAGPEVRVFQAAVVGGRRRRGVGGALVSRLLEHAAAAGAAGVSCRCLSFLDANRFWAAAGFERIATEPGAKGTLNVWARRFHVHVGRTAAPPGPTGGGAGFDFASRLHACAGCGAATVGTWVRGARRLTLCAGCVNAAERN